jgi:hypothetical protein
MRWIGVMIGRTGGCCSLREWFFALLPTVRPLLSTRADRGHTQDHHPLRGLRREGYTDSYPLPYLPPLPYLRTPTFPRRS